MGEKLTTSPLVEAACEFCFDQSSKWDWVIPGQLYEKIKAEFPDRSEIQAMGFQIKPNAEVPISNIKSGPERVQFKNTDGSAMVQVGSNRLVINHIKSYEKWEVFRKLIIDIYNKYLNVTKPNGLARIGLRYINNISINKDEKINDILTLTPNLQKSLRSDIVNFFQRYELKQTDPEGVLVHQAGFQALGEDKQIVLDLDFTSTYVKELKEVSAIESWLDKVHDVIYSAFVDSIQAGLYKKMKG